MIGIVLAMIGAFMMGFCLRGMIQDWHKPPSHHEPEGQSK